MSRRFTEEKLLVATHNRGKLEEIAHLLQDRPIAVLSAADLGLDEPEETEESFLGNARIKARAAVKASGLAALSDDSGIEIDGLGGAPGVYTADWAETPGGRDFEMAMTRAWQELEQADAPYPRTARFRCTLVLAWPDGHEEVFEGTIEGQCVWPMRGTQGHGYDPIFQPDGYEITLGEMDRWEKNRISHRGRAIARMLDACFS